MENDIRKKKTRGGQRYLMVFSPLSFQQVNTSECTQESVEELKLRGTLSNSNEEEVEQAIKHYRVLRLSFMVSSLIVLGALG